jgi:RHS repeat-associated protein
VTQLNPDASAYTGTNYNWVYLWQGGRLDTVTGNLQFGLRDYSPVLMRWTTNDPIGLAGGDTNTYRTEANGPEDQVDPNGLQINPQVIVPVSDGKGGYRPDPIMMNRLRQGPSSTDNVILGVALGIGAAAAAPAGMAAVGEGGGVLGLLKAARTWLFKAPPVCAGKGVSLAQSMAKGLVRRGGKTEKILQSIETDFAAGAPKTNLEAMELVTKAADKVGFGAGFGKAVAGQDTVLTNFEGVTTTLKTNGEIIVQKGTDIILHLIP